MFHVLVTLSHFVFVVIFRFPYFISKNKYDFSSLLLLSFISSAMLSSLFWVLLVFLFQMRIRSLRYEVEREIQRLRRESWAFRNGLACVLCIPLKLFQADKVIRWNEHGSMEQWSTLKKDMEWNAVDFCQSNLICIWVRIVKGHINSTLSTDICITGDTL